MSTPAELYPHLPGATAVHSLLVLKKKVEHLTTGTFASAGIGTAEEWTVIDAEVGRCINAADKLAACLLGFIDKNESSHLRPGIDEG